MTDRHVEAAIEHRTSTDVIEPTADGVLLLVRVLPRAGRPGIAGIRDGAVLVRVKAAPVEGAANEELIAIVARALDVARQRVTIASGVRSRAKRLRVTGLDAASAHSRLSVYVK